MALSKSLGIDPYACTPNGLQKNFTNIIREFVENSSRIIRFRLTANLSTGEDAAAVILSANGSTYVVGDACHVFDHYELTTEGSSRGMWQGVTDMEGFAKVRETSASTGRIEADIIWMEQYAGAIEFTLTSTFSAGVASATVTASWCQGVHPGDTVNVHDDQDLFAAAVIGDKGKAWRSEYAAETTPQTPYYKCLIVLPAGGGSGTSRPIVRFQLTAALETGGSAAAVIRTQAAGSYSSGAAITVYDWYGISGGGRGMFESPSGHEGYAQQREGSTTNYDIIWMETYAWHIEFTLETDMTANGEGEYTADALVTRSYEQGIDPGANVTVRDRKGLFPQAKAGAHGHARKEEYYNGTATVPEYQVIQCQQVALIGRALLAEKMCEAGVFAITDFEPMSMSPFSQNIEPTEVYNDLAHKAKSGDPIVVAWDETLDAYLVIDVRKYEITVGLTSWDEGAKCIVTTRYEIAAEICEDVQDGNVICFENCANQ